MRIVTWNIHGARDAPVARIASEVAELGPDVVCLNEVPRARARSLARLLVMRAHVASSFIGPHGNVILSRLPVASFRRVHFPGTRRVDRRDAAVVTLESGLTIAAVHLNLRAGQRMRDIAFLVGAIGGQGIIAGDVNEPPSGPVWRYLIERFDDACVDGAPTFGDMRIDGVWVPRGVAVVDCRVTSTTSSDHRPILVELEAT